MRHDLDLEVQGMAGGNRRRRPGRLLALGFVVIASLFAAPGAHAADRIYWSNFDGNSISYANLNGNGGGGTVDTTGATVAGPMGLTIDPAHDLIYWANWDDNNGTTISYANLEGGGGGDLDIQGATVAGPHGLAIDPSIGPAGRLYWPNAVDNSIGYADLDGAGGGVGGDLTITNATVDEPRGMTIDRAGGRLYWSNFSGGSGTTISYASLGPEGGDGDLLQVGSTGEGPEGVAIDPVTGRIYWSDFGAWTQLAYANGDGSNVQSFDPGSATVLGAHGVAIDPVARRLFWANYGDNSISSAGLAGGDGQDLDTSGATINGPNLPSLLEAPVGTDDPQVSGGSTTGVTLSCSPGAWAGDLLQSLLYRAPHELDYQWKLNGEDLPGATASEITASAAGKYRCRVTARNAAGATSQTSAAHGVGPKTTITKKPKSKIKTKKKSVKVKVSFKSEQGAKFKCKFDKAKYRPCSSPYSVKAKSKGGKGKKHTISIKAKDRAGNFGKPVTVKFKVIREG